MRLIRNSNYKLRQPVFAGAVPVHHPPGRRWQLHPAAPAQAIHASLWLAATRRAQGMIALELFTASHCQHCEGAWRRLTEVLPRGTPLLRRDVLKHIDRAVELGIQRTPALVVDDRLVHQAPITRTIVQRYCGELLWRE